MYVTGSDRLPAMYVTVGGRLGGYTSYIKPSTDIPLGVFAASESGRLSRQCTACI